MNSSKDIETQIKATKARRDLLASQRQEHEASLNEQRQAQGQAVARGDSQAAEQAKALILSLQADIDGLENAIPLLDAEIKDLQSKLTDAQKIEAGAEYEQALKEFDVIAAEVDQTLGDFYKDVLEPKAQALEAALQRVHHADRAQKSFTPTNPNAQTYRQRSILEYKRNGHERACTFIMGPLREYFSKRRIVPVPEGRNESQPRSELERRLDGSWGRNEREESALSRVTA